MCTCIGGVFEFCFEILASRYGVNKMASLRSESTAHPASVVNSPKPNSGGSDGVFETRGKVLVVLASLLLVASSWIMSCWYYERNGTSFDYRNHLNSTSDKPGIQVMKAILANMWPSLGKSILHNMRANPTWIDPYLLTLKGGELRYPPRINHIQPLFTEISSNPVEFECLLEYV